MTSSRVVLSAVRRCAARVAYVLAALAVLAAPAHAASTVQTFVLKFTIKARAKRRHP